MGPGCRWPGGKIETDREPQTVQALMSHDQEGASSPLTVVTDTVTFAKGLHPVASLRLTTMGTVTPEADGRVRLSKVLS